VHRAELDWLESGLTVAVMAGAKRATSIFIFAFMVSSLLSFHGALTLKRRDSGILTEKNSGSVEWPRVSVPWTMEARVLHD
jgi:hypothetical protein